MKNTDKIHADIETLKRAISKNDALITQKRREKKTESQYGKKKTAESLESEIQQLSNQKATLIKKRKKLEADLLKTTRKPKKN